MIKAIETRYKGYRFRSRLEARWAVFFDAMGVKWEYEKEGYDLGEAGWYLPDFWLPRLKCWIEIKGAHTEDASDKLAALCLMTQNDAYLFFDAPWEECGGSFTPNAFGDSFTVLEHEEKLVVATDMYHQWCDCGVCGAVGIEYGGRNDRLCNCSIGDRWHDGHPTRMSNALTAARAARFEHGEQPVV